MCRWFFPLLLFLSTCLNAQPPASLLADLAPKHRKMLERGRTFEEQGNFLAAEEQYLQALQFQKDRPVTYRHLAYLYLFTRQWEKAGSALQCMMGNFPPEEALPYWVNMPSTRFEIPVFQPPQRGTETFPSRNDEENLALIAANPLHAPAHYALGLRYWELGGQDSLTEYHLHQAVAARSDFREARRSLGQFLQLQGRFGEAEIQFQYNVKHIPDSMAHWDDLALLYFRWNRPGKLEQIWRDQLKVFPSDQRTLRNLGLLLETQGRYVEVERLYLEYQYAQKDRINGYALLESHYLRSIGAYPDSIQFRKALGELYYQQLFIQPIAWDKITKEDSVAYANYLARECLRHFQFVLEKWPDHPTLAQMSYQVGRLQVFLKNYKEAIQPLQQAVERLQEKMDSRYLLADAYIGADRPVDALALLDSLAHNPGLDYRHDVLFARLLALSGRLDEALALADSIIAYYPNSRTPESYRIKAFVLEQKGDLTGAFEAIQEVVKQEYSSAADYYQAARLYFSKEPLENGFIWLDGALDKGLPKIIVQNDPALEEARGWDEYSEIMAHY
ncbi:MAG: tetratricopeptide repeat protein [Lewinellaceae bacterium]|nr:tetratricopeptide repeat protein [Lewinellaceae bacterium]